MELLSEYGFIGIISFGSVGILIYFLAKFTKYTLSKAEKAVALFVFAFVYGFVPAEFANVIAERIKDAVYVSSGLTALYTGAKNIVSKVSSK